MGIQTIKVNQLPYLDATALEGRAVRVMPYWDGAEWHLWVPAPGGGLFRLRSAGVIESNYVARNPEQPTDLFIPFVDFLWQRASWHHTIGILELIIDDVHNLGTCFAKFEYFSQQYEKIGDGVSLFAKTELEYLLALARSTVDLCYDLFRNLWHRNVRLGPEHRRPKMLPEKLSALVFSGKREIAQVRERKDLCSKFGLTESIAEAFMKIGAFLLPIRQCRDSIIHEGRKLPTIYATERGFCVDNREEPYSTFSIWNESHRYNDRLVSIVPLIAYLVFNSIDVCNILTEAFPLQIGFPPEIAPGYHVFMRGFHNEALIRAMSVAHGNSPWPDELHRDTL